jgi:hypothetical protein
MRKLIVGAAAFGLALVSGAAMAQNVKGPAAPNFGATSGPTTGGATPNTGTAQPTNPLYNYAPGQGNNQAQPHQRRGTTGYRR